MASGFTQRWKGKIKAAQLWIGEGGIIAASTVTGGSTVIITASQLAAMFGSGAINATTLNASAATPISNFGITIIPDTTVNSTMYLADPIPGVSKYLVMTSTITSSGTRSVATLTTGVGFVGSSMGTVKFDTLNFGSSKTLMSCVEMVGLSTSLWMLVGGAYNATTVPLTTTAITLATRT